MSDWLMRVMKAEAERLIAMAADDDQLRGDLRALAEAILAATEPLPADQRECAAGSGARIGTGCASGGHT